MAKAVSREHDFESKLRQASVIARLRDYVAWQRGLEGNPGQEPPDAAPVSINLDLTSACNFSCPYCVDAAILNQGTALSREHVRKTLDLLTSKGLRSVIFLGGGEPTLHRHFGEIVRETKGKGLQVGIVTNGTGLDKVTQIAPVLEEKDWVRVSIDAGLEKTFRALHRPRTSVTLRRILKEAREVKERNPRLSLGYSFVIVWAGVETYGEKIPPNVEEMAEAVRQAGEACFDYISFKPCLVRLETSQKESLLDQVQPEEERRILEQIRVNLKKANEAAEGRIKILESVNLQAMLNQEADKIKKQPKRCHMPFFRTVVAPSGIFHCPAFRGVEKAKIAESDGYLDEVKFRDSLGRMAALAASFDAEEECKEVGCFYHHTNWWLDGLVRSEEDLQDIRKVEDENFFL